MTDPFDQMDNLLNRGSRSPLKFFAGWGLAIIGINLAILAAGVVVVLVLLKLFGVI